MTYGLLIDMDGVIYRGSEPIAGAVTFISELIQRQIPFRFLTNNSQRTRRDVARTLQQMNIEVGEEHVFTCAMATARFLAHQKPAGTAYVIGEGGLLTAMHQNGYAIVEQQPDFVVVGEGRNLSFEAIEKALNMIRGGARLIATNMDPNCPTGAGMRPGYGAVVAMLEQASGLRAFSVGKPSPVMMRLAQRELGVQPGRTVMIGDTMSTDILGGVQMGYRTVLTLSGTTRAHDVRDYAYEPDLVVDSIGELDYESLLQRLEPGAPVAA